MRLRTGVAPLQTWDEFAKDGPAARGGSRIRYREEWPVMVAGFPDEWWMNDDHDDYEN